MKKVYVHERGKFSHEWLSENEKRIENELLTKQE